MDFEQRRRIETIRDNYLRYGEAPTIISASLMGVYTISPWLDSPSIPEHPHINGRASPTEPSEINGQTNETESLNSIQETEQQDATLPFNLSSNDDESTQDFDMDMDRTIPYDVYEIPEDEHIAVSSSPP